MRLQRWHEFPGHVRDHLRERLRDRRITVEALAALQVWVQSNPEVPEGDWYKDFGPFKICGRGPDPTTFLTEGQTVWGKEIDGESDEVSAWQFDCDHREMNMKSKPEYSEGPEGWK